jgi:hypothetical protein
VHHAAAEVGRGRSGRDGVHPDAAAAEFVGLVAGEDLDRALDGAVRGMPWDGEPGQAAGDVHDGAAVGKRRQQGLREEEDTLEMHVDEAVEVLLGRLGERSSQVCAGIVDKEVERRAAPAGLQLATELLGEGSEGVHGAGVQPQRDGGSPQAGDLVGLGLVAAVRHDDIDARPGKVQGVGPPETPVGSGDDGDLLRGAHDGSSVAVGSRRDVEPDDQLTRDPRPHPVPADPLPGDPSLGLSLGLSDSG